MNEKKEQELERIVAQHQDMLFRFAYFRTGSLADAEDIVQEVFLRMLDGKRSLSHIGNLKNYLLRSVANSCCDYHKRRSKAPLPLERAAAASTEHEDPWRGEYERIEKLLDDIPCEQAEVMRMRCIDGLHFYEIADITGVPVATVKSRFRYGIDKMRALNRIKNHSYEMR